MSFELWHIGTGNKIGDFKELKDALDCVFNLIDDDIANELSLLYTDQDIEMEEISFGPDLLDIAINYWWAH